jgi:hypothetical protein
MCVPVLVIMSSSYALLVALVLSDEKALLAIVARAFMGVAGSSACAQLVVLAHSLLRSHSSLVVGQTPLLQGQTIHATKRRTKHF